jgi:hypothetical protein
MCIIYLFLESEVQHPDSYKVLRWKNNIIDYSLTIASVHPQGSGMRAMARMPVRSPATVSRELARTCRFECSRRS